MNIPNSISIFRVLLAFWAFYLFMQNHDQWLFFWLTVAVIVLDGLDGIVARWLKQTTEFGAKLDIYSDRIVELSYWLFFSYLGLLHIWVFVFFLLRGSLVDWLTRRQSKPLGDSWLRSSRFMRLAYGGFKLLSFALLILSPIWGPTLYIVYLTVVICALRALPVLLNR